MSSRIHAPVLFSWMGLLLVVMLVLAPAVTLAQDPSKPDIHFSFIIEKDGSNTTSIEIAVNPLVDPLIKKGIEFVKDSLGKTAKKKHARYEVTTTTRDKREYQALVIRYDNLGDLNALMNTPQMLSGLFKFLPNAEIPSLFSRFLATSQETDHGLIYEFNARMEPEVTQALSFANVTIHVTLPGSIDNHNADEEDPKAKELIWVMQPGYPLEISASSSISRGISGVLPTDGGLLSTIVIWGGGVLLVILFLLIIFWLIRTVRRSRSDDDEFYDGFYDYEDDW